METKRPLLLGMIFALITPCWSEARCIDLAGMWLMAKSKAAPVFRGTVLEVRRVPGGQIAKIEVDRVWRGEVAPDLTFYNFTGGVSAEGRELTLSVARRLTAGERYIFFTHEQSPEERRLFGTDASARTYGTRGCGIWPHTPENARVLGKGREVKRPKAASERLRRDLFQRESRGDLSARN